MIYYLPILVIAAAVIGAREMAGLWNRHCCSRYASYWNSPQLMRGPISDNAGEPEMSELPGVVKEQIN